MKGLRLCMSNKLMWCWSCWLIEHTLNSIGLGKLNGFSNIQAEVLLAFLKSEPITTNLYCLHLKRHLKNLFSAQEHGSQEVLWSTDEPTLPHFPLPSWNLGAGLWSGACTHYSWIQTCDEHTLQSRISSPLILCQQSESFIFPFRVDWPLNQEHFYDQVL